MMQSSKTVGLCGSRRNSLLICVINASLSPSLPRSEAAVLWHRNAGRQSKTFLKGSPRLLQTVPISVPPPDLRKQFRSLLGRCGFPEFRLCRLNKCGVVPRNGHQKRSRITKRSFLKFFRSNCSGVKRTHIEDKILKVDKSCIFGSGICLFLEATDKRPRPRLSDSALLQAAEFRRQETP